MSDTTNADMARTIAASIEPDRKEIKFDSREDAVLEYLYKKCADADKELNTARENLNEELGDLVQKHNVTKEYQWDEVNRVFFIPVEPPDNEEESSDESG